MDKKRVEIDLFFYKPSLTKEQFLEIVKSFLLFEPKKITCKSTKGNPKNFTLQIFSTIQEDFQDEDFHIYFENKNEGMSIVQNINSKNIFTCTIFINIETFNICKEKIYEAIYSVLEEGYAISSTIGNSYDIFFQNTDSLLDYEIDNKSLDGIPLKQSDLFPDDTIVDVEKLAGFYKIVDGIWFGAAWKMWFGERYFSYIPKRTLLSFNDCYLNEEMSGNVICITLYEDIFDYDNPENRTRQWKFKKAIDFDNVIHSFSTNSIEENDSSIEINTGNFEHGGVKQLKSYIDDEDNLINKSKAVKEITIEVDQSGKIIWENERVIRP